MAPIEDRKRLRLAQFKLLNDEIKLVDTKIFESVLEDLDLNMKVPETNFLKVHDNEELIGDSLLHLAFKENNIDLYNILISKGADFNIKNKQNNTVLHAAFYDFCLFYQMYKWDFQRTIFDAHTKFIVPTLSAHVKYKNTNNPSDSNGLTHFHIACGTNNTEAVEFFLNNGVSLDQAVVCVSIRKYFEGYTPLHFAAEFGYIQVAEVLLKHGANKNLENDKGQTPLHVALERNIELTDSGKYIHLPRDIQINEQIINLLLNHNVSPKFPRLFVLSAMQNSFQTESFLAQGIDVNQFISMDSQIWPGYTALHFAAHVNVDTVKLLLKHGANIDAKEANGITPFDMCVDRYRVEDIVDIINLVSTWKDLVLSDGKTKLVDFLLAFKTVNDISSCLDESKDNVKLFVPFDSPLWPGFTLLHLAVLLTERRKCKTDYKHEKNNQVFDPNLTIITECLKQDADVTIQDYRNWTAIHFAFRLEKQKTMNLLLQYHHRVKNSVDDKNLSHLHIACEAGNHDLVKKLVWNDADVNVVYKGDTLISSIYPGWTPLHIAVYKKKCKILKLLLRFGADIYIPDMYGITPIHKLMHDTDFREPSKILFGVPNLRDFILKDIGLSYLHVACATNNVDAVKQLLDLGSDINKVITWTKNSKNSHPSLFIYERYNGSTPLHFALEDHVYSRSKLLRLMIERGADILAKNSNNSSPFYDMLESEVDGIFDIIVAVLKHNVDLQKRVETETGVTMLHVACRKVDVALVRELLKNGANVNAQIHENSTIWPKYTCLHMLLTRIDEYTGDGDDLSVILGLLLNHDADVSLSNDTGDTPIHVAYRKLIIEDVDSNCLDNVNLLLKAHKNFEVNPTGIEGFSHFHIACHMLEIDIVENFLEHDVDVNSKIDMFCDSQVALSTPLHLAIKSNINLSQTDATNPLDQLFAQLKIVDLLIKHGADVNVEDIFGNTPVHYAGSSSSSKKNLLQRLVNSGANVNARNVRGETPLELMLKKENFTLEEVCYFIAFGCRFNAFNTVTEKGYIALADSTLAHNEMQILLFGAFVNTPDSMKVDYMKRTAIHNVVSINTPETIQAQYIDLFNLFMTFGCDVDDQDDLGRTPLHLAVLFRNEPAVAGLLLVGANINITDHEGKTPFAYAFEPCSRCSSDSDDDHDQYSHSKLFKTFMSQMKKMEFCDIFVNKANGVLLNKAFEIFDSDGIKRDLEDILPEIAQIADIKMEPYSITVADFVSAADAVINYPMMPLDKRRAIGAFFRANKKFFQKQFKQTAGIFQLQYRQAVLRRKIINEAIESLRVLARCRLPDICSHVILRSLKNFELQNLIASTPKN